MISICSFQENHRKLMEFNRCRSSRNPCLCAMTSHMTCSWKGMPLAILRMLGVSFVENIKIVYIYIVIYSLYLISMGILDSIDRYWSFLSRFSTSTAGMFTWNCVDIRTYTAFCCPGECLDHHSWLLNHSCKLHTGGDLDLGIQQEWSITNQWLLIIIWLLTVIDYNQQL